MKSYKIFQIIFIALLIFSCAENNEDYFIFNQGTKDNIAKFNDINILTLESIGSNNLSDVNVKIFKSSGELVKEFVTTETSEKIYLENGSYKIEATKSKHGKSSYVDFLIPSYRENIKLVLPLLKSTSYEANFLELYKVQYKLEDNVYRDFENCIVVAPNAIKSLIVGVKSKNAIMKGQDFYAGVGILFDRDASGFGSIAPTTFIKTSELDDDGFYNTEVEFDFTKYQFSYGRHYIDLVAYDIAGNRISKMICFKTQKIDKKDTNISLIAPSVFVSGRAFPIDRKILSTVTKNKYFVLTISFNDKDDIPIPVRGVYIYRSTDKKDFKFIDKVSSTTLADFSGVEYLDVTTNFENNKLYYYKVIAFNNDYLSRTSAVASTFIPDAHTYELISPSKRAVISQNNVSLKFQFTSQIAEFLQNFDIYYFSLSLNDIGPNSTNNYTFMYDIRGNKFYRLSGLKFIEVKNNIVNLTNDTITIYPAELNYKFNKGFTYEWDISLNNHGPYFKKIFYQNNKEVGEAVSYSSTIENNSHSNGPFKFTIGE